MANKNAFEGNKPVVEQPPIVRPQNWGDVKPMATDLKKAILKDVQKNVIAGDVMPKP